MLTDTPCTRWEDVNDWAAEAGERLAPAAWAVKASSACVYTEGDVGYYADPATGRVSVLGRGATEDDLDLCKRAVDRAVGPDLRGPDLSIRDVVAYPWVKVAWSPLLRRAGELLNFFPGRYPGGIPNAPSPLAAALSGGLVGAGLGYGAGWLGEKVLPGWEEDGRLRRTLGVLGGLAGAFPGAVGIYTNHRQGLTPLDGRVLAPPPGSPPSWDLDPVTFSPPANGDELYSGLRSKLAGDDDTGFGAFAPARREPTLLDVNVDALGRTLWDSGADPRLLGTTVSVLRSAAMMPGGRGVPGYVTPAQVGELAMAAGAGYASGALVGAVLGALTGLPEPARQYLARTGATVGIVRQVVPALFGQ